jgi:hypothetical protein
MKSLLLGSAATLVVVAGAQAADLPTKKGAPAAEYVKVCKIGNIAGFIIPGSDTCLKIGGLVTAQTTYGSTADQYNIATNSSGAIPGSLVVSKYARERDQIGMYTRGRISVDAVSNTAYGPLLAHINIEGNSGGGFDSSASTAVLDGAWIQWAGITAGSHTSFFDFIGGGYAWDDLASPKFDPTNQLAYTATFGGGFSATLSLEQPEPAVYSQGGNNWTNEVLYGNLYNSGRLGLQSPDFVASLDVTQGWGSAHLAGLLHQVRQYAGTLGASNEQDINDWGWGILGGVSFNIPSLGAGADVKLQGFYSEGALQYSHLFGGIGSFNFSGVSYDGAAADAYYNATTGSWEKPTNWGVAAQVDLPLGPTFKVVPEVAYEEVHISGTSAVKAVNDSSLSPNVDVWVGGAVFEWTPVHNLVFDLDLLYANIHQSAPDGWTGTGVSAWKTTADGFNGKLRIERDF